MAEVIPLRIVRDADMNPLYKHKKMREMYDNGEFVLMTVVGSVNNGDVDYLEVGPPGEYLSVKKAVEGNVVTVTNVIGEPLVQLHRMREKFDLGIYHLLTMIGVSHAGEITRVDVSSVRFVIKQAA